MSWRPLQKVVPRFRARPRSWVAAVRRHCRRGARLLRRRPPRRHRGSSALLHRENRSAATDHSGQTAWSPYPDVCRDLHLPGFNTVKREGVVLDARFTAPVNARCASARSRDGHGHRESPIVDVQNTMRRETVNCELLDTPPTGRDFR